MSKILPAVLAAFALAGCASYRWTSSVPADMRTVSVPTFRNESDIVEFGAVTTRQVLREFQREGTFAIRMSGDAAIEVQGVVKSVGGGMTGYDRRRGLRLGGQSISATAVVSLLTDTVRVVSVLSSERKLAHGVKAIGRSVEA